MALKAMLLGVVSDTHGHLENTHRAVRMLESLSVEQVIHCGDIGSPEIPALFAAWPTHFVFGNVDYDLPQLRAAIHKAKLKCHERFGELQLAGRNIAFLHSDDGKRFQQTINENRFDLICYGHTHVAKAEQIGRSLVLNPGALYRASSHTIAVVNLATMEVTSVQV
jgi:putative phosphoesterase